MHESRLVILSNSCFNCSQINYCFMKNSSRLFTFKLKIHFPPLGRQCNMEILTVAIGLTVFSYCYNGVYSFSLYIRNLIEMQFLCGKIHQFLRAYINQFEKHNCVLCQDEDHFCLCFCTPLP